MKVMAFDLSSRCIGVVCAEIDARDNIKNILSCPIVPKKFDATLLGFKKSKVKFILSDGSSISAWGKEGETSISKAEKKKRDSQVRAQRDVYVLREISETIGMLIENIQPDLVLVEKNEIFNGILTSVLLGKVMGVLHGVCGSRGVPIEEYRVQSVRKPYNVMKLTMDFVSGKNPEELSRIPDISKRVIREMLSLRYPSISFQTDDESDACLVFDYWLNFIRKSPVN